MAAEEFTQAMNGVREFNRLQGIDLKSYQCETIFVDPPRSGLDSEESTEKMVQAYPRILYISCNPETLCKNLETLSQTHKVERLALFNRFPSAPYGVRRITDREVKPMPDAPASGMIPDCSATSCLRLRIFAPIQNTIMTESTAGKKLEPISGYSARTTVLYSSTRIKQAAARPASLPA